MLRRRASLPNQRGVVWWSAAVAAPLGAAAEEEEEEVELFISVSPVACRVETMPLRVCRKAGGKEGW